MLVLLWLCGYNQLPSAPADYMSNCTERIRQKQRLREALGGESDFNNYVSLASPITIYNDIV